MPKALSSSSRSTLAECPTDDHRIYAPGPIRRYSDYEHKSLGRFLVFNPEFVGIAPLVARGAMLQLSDDECEARSYADAAVDEAVLTSDDL